MKEQHSWAYVFILCNRVSATVYVTSLSSQQCVSQEMSSAGVCLTGWLKGKD